MIKSIIVLGGGSAGLMAGAALKLTYPSLSVRLIYSSEIPIIGVGEGTTPGLARFLHQVLHLPLDLLFTGAAPTIKLGLRLEWGPRPYFNYAFGPGLGYQIPPLPRQIGFYCCGEMEFEDPISSLMTLGKAAHRKGNQGNQGDRRPALPANFAYHLENTRFVAFLEKVAAAAEVEFLDDTFLEAPLNENGVDHLRLKSGRTESADLYIDASGFGSVLLGKTLAEPFISFASTLVCDRAVIGGWERSVEPILPYTTCQTLDAGWSWQIEHPTRINRGYVYSSSFLSDDDAEREFRKLNPKLGDTRIVKFITGRYRNCFVKNVVAIGNASGFVEPLEATALTVIANQSRRLAELIRMTDGRLTPSLARLYNDANARTWDDIRRFLGIHYKYNTRLDTPFWRHCREKTDLAGGEAVVEYYQQNGPITLLSGMLIDPISIFGLEGYITLLLGQNVPHAPHVPTPAQQQAWEQIRAQNRANAMSGWTMEQLLLSIRSGQMPVQMEGPQLG